MSRFVMCALVLLASCQSKDSRKQPPAPPPSTGDAGTRSEASSTDAPVDQAPRAPLPPLPDPLPGTRSDMTSIVGTTVRAAIGDFDGNKKRELALADQKTLRIVDAKGKQLASVDVSAGIHVMAVADLDGDGTHELLTGWGQSREFMAAKSRVSIFRLKGGKLVEETIATPDSERAEVTTVFAVPEDKAVFVAYFDSKFNVTSALARKSGSSWQLQTLASIRMATTYGRGDVDGDGTADLVVGRMYGDDKGVDGDAFVLALDGTRTPLPTTRGLRSLAVIGSDIFMGDGWHQNYGEHARGRLTRVAKAAAGFKVELIEDTPGQHSIERIVPATIDGATVLVAVGSHYVRAYKQQGSTWRGLTIAGAARDVAVGDLDGKPGDEVLVVGDTSALVGLAGVAW